MYKTTFLLYEMVAWSDEILFHIIPLLIKTILIAINAPARADLQSVR